MQPTFTGVLIAAALTTAVVFADRIPLPTGAPQSSSGVAQAKAAAGGGAGDAAAGRTLFTAKGCVACHVAAGVPGAVGILGPNLNGIGDATKHTRLVTGDENTPANLSTWIKDPPARKPGTQMPNLGLSQREADDLAAFLSTLK